MAFHIRALVTLTPDAESTAYTLKAVTEHGARGEALKKWPTAHAIRLEEYSLRRSAWVPYVNVK